MKLHQLSPFLRGYLTAAFWTNDDDAPGGEYSTSGRPEAMFDDLAEDALLKATRDCRRFADQQAENLRLSGLGDEQAGHDFWLTRNGHGSGFWDRDNVPETQREALAEAAHAFGECDLYRGDDGKLYFS